MANIDIKSKKVDKNICYNMPFDIFKFLIMKYCIEKMSLIE